MKSIAASIVMLSGAVVMQAGVGKPTYEPLILLGGIVMLGGAALIFNSWRDKRD
jgi:hypothetical protein